MARDISVYRKSDLDWLQSPSNHDVNSEEFESWCQEAQTRCLYEEPLGSEGAIRAFWSGPACELGLPLIADIYDRGFVEGITWADNELEQAANELIQLEKHWLGLGLEDELLDDLLQRKSYLLEAISIAQKNDGVVDIG